MFQPLWLSAEAPTSLATSSRPTHPQTPQKVPYPPPQTPSSLREKFFLGGNRAGVGPRKECLFRAFFSCWQKSRSHRTACKGGSLGFWECRPFSRSLASMIDSNASTCRQLPVASTNLLSSKGHCRNVCQSIQRRWQSSFCGKYWSPELCSATEASTTVDVRSHHCELALT